MKGIIIKMDKALGQLSPFFIGEGSYAAVSIDASHLVVELGHGAVREIAPGKISPRNQVIDIIHKRDDG